MLTAFRFYLHRRRQAIEMLRLPLLWLPVSVTGGAVLNLSIAEAGDRDVSLRQASI
jgi:hypothetical protein